MLFRDKYRIPSARWQPWDYSRPARYFVTVCTKDKACLFGKVVRGQVKLSAMGRIVAEEWQKTSQVRAGIELDESQIMSNHLHGIIHILNSRDGPVGRLKNETFHRNVSTSSLKPSSLGSIMGQFKSACTRRIWAAGFHDFAWHPRFFDRVIRNQDELEKLRDYIRHNPLMWDKEQASIENLLL